MATLCPVSSDSACARFWSTVTARPSNLNVGFRSIAVAHSANTDRPAQRSPMVGVNVAGVFMTEQIKRRRFGMPSARMDTKGLLTT